MGTRKLGAMATDEAVMLMLKTAGIDDLSDRSARMTAEPVVWTLGCLALVITQAGSVIQQGHCDLQDYCTLYAWHCNELLSQQVIQGGDDY